MRRIFPILLLAAFLVPLLAPLLALGQGDDSGLPACCRRDGKHHCAMSMAQRRRLATQDLSPKWTTPMERCPYWPATLAPGHLHEIFAMPPAQALYAESRSNPASAVQTECKRRISRDRSRQKRGPPAAQLL